MFHEKMNSVLRPLHHAIPKSFGIELFVKRDDLLHEHVSGNKWRKLKYNLIYAKNAGYNQILTFGGAFSNHLVATAAACSEMGIKSIGIVRGEELNDQANPSLRTCSGFGMELHFIPRQEYRRREDKHFIEQLLGDVGPSYMLPEGGSNALAVKGCQDIVEELDLEFDTITCPVGTGGTLAGISSALTGSSRALGIAVLKNALYLNDEVERLHQDSMGVAWNNWEINHEYHFGGYGKYSEELVDFINGFKSDTGIQLDPIYTGKMVFGLFDLIKKSYFSRGSKIVVLHTGGLQGIWGFNQMNGHLIKTD